MEDVSDDELIRMYCDGDPEAFDTLFDRYHASVYNFARTMLGDSGAAEEVLQETFLTVAQTAKTYRPSGRFRAWAMRIVRNRCLNRIEAERARRELVAAGGFGAVEPAADDPDPSEQVRADEETAAIRAAIATLPDRQREAIALYAFEQMRYREIADVLDVPINTVKTLIHRARASLAQMLDSDHQERKREL